MIKARAQAKWRKIKSIVSVLACLCVFSKSAFATPTIERIVRENKHVQEVVLVTTSPFLGDNIIYEYSKIPFLKKAFPRAKIKVVSRTSSILVKSGRLVPIYFPMDEYRADEKIEEYLLRNPNLITDQILNFLKNNISPKAVVIWDVYNFGRLIEEIQYAVMDFSKDRPEVVPQLWQRFGPNPHVIYGALYRYLAQSLRLSEQFEKFLVENKMTSIGLDQLGEKETYRTVLGKSDGVRIHSEVLEREFQDNVYVGADWNLKRAFGANASAEWDRRLYDDKSRDKDVKALLFEEFGNPKASFIIVNLNTISSDKINDVTSDYVFRLRSLLEYLTGKYPKLKIFVNAAEANFGPAIARETQVLLHQFAVAGVRSLPQNRKLWQPLIKLARAVVTQDSGFLHVAYMLSENVIAIGRAIGFDEQGDPIYRNRGEMWGKPGTKLVPYYHGVDPNRKVYEAIDQLLSDSECESDLK